MGILCDPDFKSGKVNNTKVNDIIATVSFIDNAMGKFLENCVLQEIYDLSDILSKQPEFGISKVTKLPHNKIAHWVTEKISYSEKHKLCKKIAPSLFEGHNEALKKMGEIRNRVAHEWFRGGTIDQSTKKAIDQFCKDYDLKIEIKDINDEYDNFQKLYNKHREFILTLEQKWSSEHLDLHEK